MECFERNQIFMFFLLDHFVRTDNRRYQFDPIDSAADAVADRLFGNKKILHSGMNGTGRSIECSNTLATPGVVD